MEIPRWMQTLGPPAIEQPVRLRTSRGPRLWRRALESLARVVEELVSNQAVAEQPGLLQGVEARAKVLGLMGLLVAATWVRSLPALGLAYGVCLLLAVLSRVPARKLGRAWLVVPVFSAAIVLPAVLNVITPGQPLLTLARLSVAQLGPWRLPPELTVTDAGVLVATRFVLRTGVCVTLALLLTATTPSARLFHGLRALGMPRLFVMLLGMMDRYLALLVRGAEEIHLAKLSRSAGVETLHQEQAWVASGMGALFRRTRALGEAVYLAMISRGYSGEARLLAEPRWGLNEWAFLMVAAGGAALLVTVG